MNTSIRTRIRTLTILLAATMGAAMVQTSVANAADEVPRGHTETYVVGYSDLDLSDSKDVRLLYLRLRYAAVTLCESAATWGKKVGEACVRKAMDDAVARADAPLLSQYYQLRSKGDKAGLVRLAKAKSANE
jgi:UrcA family protein